MPQIPSHDKNLDAQVAAWVDNLCRTHEIDDPKLIAAAKRKVKHFVLSRMEEENIAQEEGLIPLLAEALKTLNKHLNNPSRAS